MKTAREIAEILGNATKNGNGYKCRCPVHDDKHASLHISQAEDGGFLAYCWAGCDKTLVWQTVRDVCGLNGERLSGSAGRGYLPPREPDPVDLKMNGILPVADWRYRSASGTLLFVVARYEIDGRKTIRPWTWDGAKWIPKSLPAPRPLYGLQDLAKRKDATVIVVEGEKTAEAARVLFRDYVCITWPGGSAGCKHVDFSPLKGRRVYLLPDADDPGRAAMGDVEAILKPLECAITHIAPPLDVPAGWDVADADWTPDQAAAWLRDAIPGIRAMDWHTLGAHTPPTREWLIDEWLGVRHPTLFVGPGGVGKSLLAQQTGAALSVCAPFFGPAPPRALRVLMWMCEDDHDELWRRQVAISHWLKHPIQDFTNLIIIPRFGLDNTLLSTEFGRPIWTPLLAELREQCSDLKADVCFIDNIGQVFGANENVRHDVTVFINGVSGACGQTTPVFLGHPSRGAGSEFSGSSAWENAVRMRWWFSDRLPDDKSDPEEERDESIRFLSKRKTNYSTKDFRQFNWNDGVFETSTVPSSEDDALRSTMARRVVVHSIEKLSAMDVFGSDSPSANYLPSLIVKFGLSDGLPPAVLARAMRALMLDGTIVKGVVGKDKARRPRYGLVVKR